MTCPHYNTVTHHHSKHQNHSQLTRSSSSDDIRIRLSKQQNDSQLTRSDFNRIRWQARTIPVLTTSSLIEDMFSDEVLSYGVGKLRYPDDSKAASEFSLDVSEIVTEVESRVERILVSLADYKSPARMNYRIGEALNEIGDAIRKRFGIPLTDYSREFTCRFGYDEYDLSMSIMGETAKPKLATFERGTLAQEEIYWGDVQCPLVIEETRSTSVEKLLVFANHIFSSQLSQRRFVIGIAIINNEFDVLCFDRSGSYTSVERNIKKSPRLFARVIAGLLFADKTDLGYDGSVLAYNNIIRMSANEKGYIVRHALHITSNLVGSGVSCFHVKRRREDYVIKDLWINRWDKSREQDILERIRGIENVVQLVSHEVLKTRTGAIDSTELHSKKVFGAEDSSRVTLDHHRIVITPYGMPFKSFSSLEELISGLRDVVKAIKDLSEIGILHADISSHNVVLVPHPDPSVSLRRACLIDFGCSIDLRKQAENHDISGTPFFTALSLLLEALLGDAKTRRYYHDLESVMYLLCYMCINYYGPNSDNISEKDFRRTIIPTWSGGARRSCVDACYAKCDAVESKDAFRRTVLTQFQPYFDDLHACAEGMYDVLFPVPIENSEIQDLYEERDELERSIYETEALPEHELDAKTERYSEVLEAIRSIEKVTDEEIRDRTLRLQSPADVFDKFFKILDDTLDMLRKKVVDSKEKEDAFVPEETSVSQQDEDCMVEPCEPNSSMGEGKTIEEPELAQKIQVAVANESSLGVLEEQGKEELADISQATDDSCGQVQVDNNKSADFPKHTAEAAVACQIDDSCQRSKCKGEGRPVQVAVPMVVGAASAHASCLRDEGTGKKGVPKDSSCDASCGRGGKIMETPVPSMFDVKRKRIEEDEESDSDADSGRSVRKRQKLRA